MTLAALVLAAGSATRFGGDKLAATFRNEPVLAHAIRAARAAPVDRVIVVAAPGLAIGMWGGKPPVEVLHIASDALSASLKAGIAAVHEAQGAFVFLGDMPLVPHGIALELADRLPGHFAVVPRCGGRPGHPVLLSRAAFPAVAQLSGDEGAGRLLKRRSDVDWLDVADRAILFDIDRREDLARLAEDRTNPGED